MAELILWKKQEIDKMREELEQLFGRFRRDFKWGSEADWIRQNVWHRSLLKIMEQVAAVDQNVIAAIQATDELSKKSDVPLTPIGEPLASVRKTALAWKSENHSAPSCQRGLSENVNPSRNTFACRAAVILCSSGGQQLVNRRRSSNTGRACRSR